MVKCPPQGPKGFVVAQHWNPALQLPGSRWLTLLSDQWCCKLGVNTFTPPNKFSLGCDVHERPWIKHHYSIHPYPKGLKVNSRFLINLGWKAKSSSPQAPGTLNVQIPLPGGSRALSARWNLKLESNCGISIAGPRIQPATPQTRNSTA